MKRKSYKFRAVLIIALAHLLICSSLWAQAPEKMSYQSVIRNSSNALVTNTTVGMQISILQGSANGTAVYVETQMPTTNANGLATIEIGTGTSSNNFSAINWANGPYFIKTETDIAGGANYTITGTSQLLSVPYALYAKTASTVLNETDPLFNESIAADITSGDTAYWNGKLDNIPTYSIGDFAHGGVVFWVDETGQHGLVCALVDQDGGSGIKWRAGSTNYNTLFLGGGSRAYGGEANTTQILAVHAAKNDMDPHAASVCRYYSAGDFGDWYLPNMWELNQIYLNRAVIEPILIAHGGTAFANEHYWTSTEGNSVSAAYVGFDNINSGTTSKSELKRVRAIRAF